MSFKDLQYLGKTHSGEYAFAGIAEGIIGNIVYYDYVKTGSGYHAIWWCGSGFDANLRDRKRPIKSGDKAPKARKLPKYLADAYESDVSFCDCGTAWDLSDLEYPDSGCRYTDDGISCVECLTADDMLVEFNNPDDLFKARNVSDIDLKDYSEIDTLFCDSSGRGSANERALTAEQAEKRAKSILSDRKKSQLYVGLTGIGQFQVYVTVYQKAA